MNLSLGNQKLITDYQAHIKQHGLEGPQAVRYMEDSISEIELPIFVEAMQLTPHSTILDYGCGNGQLLQYLLDNDISFAQYTGVDIVPEYLDYCRQKFSEYFFFSEAPTVHTFSTIAARGVFQARRGTDVQMRDSWKSTVRQLFGQCTDRLVFDIWSVYVDREHPERYYENPAELFSFGKVLHPHCGIDIQNGFYPSSEHTCPYNMIVTYQRPPVRL